MSDCMIIRRGGSANINPSGAVLICETKVENSASISKSGKTISLTPDKAFHDDDVNKAKYIFPISKSNLGTWTLEVSKDEETKSKSVTLAAGQLLIESLNISNGVILSPETGLDPGAIVNIGTYNSINKTISFDNNDYYSLIQIKGFDPSDYTKCTIMFSANISNITCSVSKGTNRWGRSTADAVSTVVINKDPSFSPDGGDWTLSMIVTSTAHAVVTSIIFE